MERPFWDNSLDQKILDDANMSHISYLYPGVVPHAEFYQAILNDALNNCFQIVSFSD